MTVFVGGKDAVRADEVGFRTGTTYRVRVIELVTKGWREAPSFTGRYVERGRYYHHFEETVGGTGTRRRMIPKRALLTTCDVVTLP